MVAAYQLGVVLAPALVQVELTNVLGIHVVDILVERGPHSHDAEVVERVEHGDT